MKVSVGVYAFFTTLLLNYVACAPSPPTTSASRLGIDLNEAVRDLSDDGTLNLLDSLSRGPHDSSANEGRVSGYSFHAGTIQPETESHHHEQLPDTRHLPRSRAAPVVLPPNRLSSPLQQSGAANAQGAFQGLPTFPPEETPSTYALSKYPPRQDLLPSLSNLQGKVLPEAGQVSSFDYPSYGRLGVGSRPDQPLQYELSLGPSMDSGPAGTSSSRPQNEATSSFPPESVSGSSSSPLELKASLLGPKRVAMQTRRRYQQFPNTQAGLAERERFNPNLFDGSEAQIRQKAVHDPNFFSGAPFRLLLWPDPAVDRLVSILRSTSPRAEHKGAFGGTGPAELVTRVRNNPETFVRRYFWLRKEATQVLLQGTEGTRSLFLVHQPNPTFLSGKPTNMHIGVWEIVPSHESGVLGLNLHGFYPFSLVDYRALAQHPQATGRKYWLVSNRLRTGHGGNSVALTIVRINHEDNASLLRMDPALERQQDVQELLRSGQLVEVLSRTAMVPGRWLYVYQLSPETRALLDKWKIAADLPQSSFAPFKLTAEQIEDLGINTALNYRKPRPVKIVVEANGETYMLTSFSQLSWLTQSRHGVVSVWKLEAEVEGRRLMICRGFFQVPEYAWHRMTPATVPGLRDSAFQYNYVQPP